VSVADDKTILAATAITQDMLACPLQGCVFFIEVPAVPVVENIANALGMTGQGLAQLHAEQAAWEAAGKMRSHLQGHSVEDWLTRHPRSAS
jgi:hypothetical protein